MKKMPKIINSFHTWGMGGWGGLIGLDSSVDILYWFLIMASLIQVKDIVTFKCCQDLMATIQILESLHLAVDPNPHEFSMKKGKNIILNWFCFWQLSQFSI